MNKDRNDRIVKNIVDKISKLYNIKDIEGYIVYLLSEKDRSPKEISELTSEPFGSITRRLKKLTDIGVIEKDHREIPVIVRITGKVKESVEELITVEKSFDAFMHHFTRIFFNLIESELRILHYLSQCKEGKSGTEISTILGLSHHSYTILNGLVDRGFIHTNGKLRKRKYMFNKDLFMESTDKEISAIKKFREDMIHFLP